MTRRSAAGPCGGGGECQWHLAARVAARDSPAGDGVRTDDVELLIRESVCARVSWLHTIEDSLRESV